MKGKFNMLLVAAACVLAVSCSDGIEHKDDFEKSRKAWNEFKKASGNSYEYVTATSSWVGVTTETTVTVTDGVITKRHYVVTFSPDSSIEIPEEQREWTETGSDINSHKPESLTLEEIYDKAETDWLEKGRNAKYYFETDGNGLISLCGYVEEGCADDCFRGIRIEGITALR